MYKMKNIRCKMIRLRVGFIKKFCFNLFSKREVVAVVSDVLIEVIKKERSTIWKGPLTKFWFCTWYNKFARQWRSCRIRVVGFNEEWFQIVRRVAENTSMSETENFETNSKSNWKPMETFAILRNMIKLSEIKNRSDCHVLYSLHTQNNSIRYAIKKAVGVVQVRSY